MAVPRAITLSKEMIKRKIVEMLVVHKKDKGTSTKKPWQANAWVSRLRENQGNPKWNLPLNFWSVNLQFLVTPYKIVNNYTLRRSFVVTLDVMASLVHLKLKFCNFPGEQFTINVDLEGEKRIYKALYQDYREGRAMEINVATLTRQLRSRNIQPSRSG